MSDQINDLLAQVPTSARSSKWMDRVTDDSREVLELFQAWLTESDGKSEATARAYKVYVAQALCTIQDGGDVQELSTDVRSALNALRRFQQAVGAAPAPLPEPDDVDPDEDE